MPADDAVAAVLGRLPEALAERVTLATPLTLFRIEGRDEVVAVLQKLAAAFGTDEADCTTVDDGRVFVTFVSGASGQENGLFATLTCAADGRYSAVDLYAWPCPARIPAREDIDPALPDALTGPTQSLHAEGSVLAGRPVDVAAYSLVFGGRGPVVK